MTDLLDYGFYPTGLTDDSQGIPARITAVHKERWGIVSSQGEGHARLKTAVYYGEGLEPFPTVGDFVLIQYNDSGDSLIVKTLPRCSFFSRRDPTPGRGEQAVCANFDYVFIMQSLNLDFNLKRIERYLTLAWQSGATPAVILTKADLVEDFSQQVQMVEAIAPGIGVFAVSAKSGFGIDALGEYLKPRKTIVFLGSSGVGKSSFVNALAGEPLMAVNTIREDDSKGRHTTTHRQLILLENPGAMIIDTPGMRELGMWDVSIGLNQSFSDVDDFLGNCKFSDCTHRNEPGCAIREALQSGSLSESRWNSYLKLKKEAKYSEHKDGYLRERQQLHKTMARTNRQKQGRKR